MTFGTALHEVLQHYLDVMYEKSGAEADRIDIEELFEETLRKWLCLKIIRKIKVNTFHPLKS